MTRKSEYVCVRLNWKRCSTKTNWNRDNGVSNRVGVCNSNANTIDANWWKNPYAIYSSSNKTHLCHRDERHHRWWWWCHRPNEVQAQRIHWKDPKNRRNALHHHHSTTVEIRRRRHGADLDHPQVVATVVANVHRWGTQFHPLPVDETTAAASIVDRQGHHAQGVHRLHIHQNDTLIVRYRHHHHHGRQTQSTRLAVVDVTIGMPNTIQFSVFWKIFWRCKHLFDSFVVFIDHLRLYRFCQRRKAAAVADTCHYHRHQIDTLLLPPNDANIIIRENKLNWNATNKQSSPFFLDFISILSDNQCVETKEKVHTTPLSVDGELNRSTCSKRRRRQNC